MSCSEILALSLRENLSNAYLIGEKTYKKNIGQTQYYNDKYNFIMSIVTFKWDINGDDVNEIDKYIYEDNHKYNSIENYLDRIFYLNEFDNNS
ncbi:hypothetical protein JOC73_002606 [Alkaliphilus hydrothermalis]|uniref:Uncharacterized protein n=2 Tax=Alkaliphilus hydrothermalis TaxID=1482730 RepID=A0ABS2NSU6_9FIRM|nr:hypothetical protein [Alkaliphilus hydrothermalis]